MTGLTWISNWLVTLERVACRFLIAGFVGLIVVNVGSRYVLGHPIAFAEELAAILLVWLAFVSISISIAERSQVCVTMVKDLLPRSIQWGLGKLVGVIVIAMLTALLWASVGWLLAPATAFEQVITTGWLKLPFYLVVPIFCATALVHVFADFFAAPKTRTFS